VTKPDDHRAEAHPVIDPATMASMSGLEYLKAMMRGELPRMPVEKTLGFEILEADEGLLP
jgi:hypothetical protein